MKNKKSKKSDFEFRAIENLPKQPISSESAKNLYLEILNYQRKQKNGLLGEYDTSGKYSIKDVKILQNLLLIPKKFEEKQDDVVYASAKQDNFVLNFKIVFKIDVDFSTAEIYLIEIEHGIEEDIKHLTKLDEYLAINSATFKDEVFKIWKIWTDEDVYEKNDQLFEYLRFQHEEFLFNRELTEILSQLYVVRLLKILESSGELGLNIIQEYKMFLEKKQLVDPDFHLSYTNLKEVLDHFMLKHNAFEEVLTNSEAAIVLQGYSQPIKRFKDKIPVTEISDSKKEEKKEEKKTEKKSEPKKAKAKAKAKSGGGKPSKIDIKFGGKTYSPLPSPKAPVKPKEIKVPVVKQKNEKEKSQILSPKVGLEPNIQQQKNVEVVSLDAEKFLNKVNKLQNEPPRTQQMLGAGSKQKALQSMSEYTNQEKIVNVNVVEVKAKIIETNEKTL